MQWDQYKRPKLPPITAVMAQTKGPSFPSGNRSKAAKAGLAFERAFCARLKLERGKTFFPHLWFRYQTKAGWHWCQTDGILALPDSQILVVYECKLKHTPRSWFQLRELYLPVVKACFGEAYDVRLVEVVKYFDPATPYPEKPVMMKTPYDFPPAGHIGVWVWR